MKADLKAGKEDLKASLHCGPWCLIWHSLQPSILIHFEAMQYLGIFLSWMISTNVLDTLSMWKELP